MGEALERLLACPACLEGSLAGLPILLPPGSEETGAHDELDHSHKRRQAGWFDRSVAERFEIERPHGAPRACRCAPAPPTWPSSTTACTTSTTRWSGCGSWRGWRAPR